MTSESEKMSRMEQRFAKHFCGNVLTPKLKAFMMGKGLWEEDMEKEIPLSYQKFNNYVLIKNTFFVHENWRRAGAELWELVSELFLDVPNIALYGKVNNNLFRTPNIQMVYGTDKWVMCVDNRIKFTWMVDRIVFSKGNLIERHRIAKLNCKNKVVVDMCAGIGYFTLPYLVHAKAKIVYALDRNYDALLCLSKNLELNHVEKKCTIIAGNVKEVFPRGLADHVNLGLIPSSEEYWEAGTRALKRTGGVLHIHGMVCTKAPPINRAEVLGSEENKDSDKCIECVSAMRELNLLNPTHPASASKTSFSIIISRDGLTKSFNPNGDEFHWENVGFFKWVFHVTHSIAFLLVNTYDCTWIAKPVYFNPIKKYAPDVFHVVVDVACRPLQMYG